MSDPPDNSPPGEISGKLILSKLEQIIAQNEQIIEENKSLKTQNHKLIKTNTILQRNLERSERNIVEMHEKIDRLLDSSNNVKHIEDKLENMCQSTINACSSQQLFSTPTPIIPKKHAVIISPNESNDMSPTTWSSIASKKLSNVQINKLSVTKNGKCYIKFPDKENQEKAIKTLKDEFKVTSETKVTGLTPKITLCDLDADLYSTKDQEQLKNDILSKNPKIHNYVKDGKTFEILFIQETQSTNRAIIKVDPEILNYLSNLKEVRKTNAVIFVQNSVCRYFNRFHILQCYQCQTFGHRRGASSCPLSSTNRNTCLYCSGNHPSKECNFKKQPDHFKCANCTRFQGDDTQNTCHTTTDHACPFYQKQIEHVLKTTRGISKMSKNDFPKHVFTT